MKKRIWYIPIEPLNERYTEQWYRWFPEEFKQAGYYVTTLDGEALTDKIKTGEFLDVNSTLHYKAVQLQKIGKLFYTGQIKEGDIFFVADLEFWGIESIRYLSVLNKIPVKIYGFLHAASYTPEDFMQPCEDFGQLFENGWIRICDKVFVATEYHKELIKEKRPRLTWKDVDKIVVTGSAWSTKDAWHLLENKPKKQNRIIYTDLPDQRKRPGVFLSLIPLLHKRLPDTKILLTTSRDEWSKGYIREQAELYEKMGWLEIKRGLTKKQYYTELANSQVMVSTNTVTESFGYCAIEALTFDTNPVLPNMFSYPELTQGDKRLLYNSVDELLALVADRIDTPISTQKYAQVYDKAIQNMIKEMG